MCRITKELLIQTFNYKQSICSTMLQQHNIPPIPLRVAK